MPRHKARLCSSKCRWRNNTYATESPYLNILDVLDILDVINVTYKYLSVHSLSDTHDKFNTICV